MLDLWLFLLLLTAIAIGWWLGRRGERLGNRGSAAMGFGPQYYQGLNYLLNDQPDAAIDSFVESLEVNGDTLETHLAVGNLMRRKGEVERAIRIHQNLLARPSLSRVHQHMAHLELARDYIAAGLLDRAERLLIDLSGQSPDLKSVALKHLLEIYQDEREWQKAISTAIQLLPKKGLLRSGMESSGPIQKALAHYCCELANETLQKKDFRTARGWLKQALGYDRACVRAALLRGEAELKSGHYRKAMKALHRVRHQNIEFIPEMIPLLKECYYKLGDRSGYKEYLLDSLAEYPSVSLLLAAAEEVEKDEGEESAAAFIGAHLKRRPSLKGLSKLIEMHIKQVEGPAHENMSILQTLVESLLTQKHSYRCQHCGFSGQKLHWLCPSCKEWGEIRPIRGVEGD